MSISFDENVSDHRDFYRAGYGFRLRSAEPLPASLKATPLGEIAELGYTDAASGKKPRIPVDLPKSYFDESGRPKSPEPPAVPPAPENRTVPTTQPTPKGEAKPANPKTDEEFLPPSDQAKYWYLRGFSGEAVREPAEFSKWYRSGLRDRAASLPSRIPVTKDTSVVPAPGGSDLTMPLLGLGGVVALGLGFLLLKRRKRSRS